MKGIVRPLILFLFYCLMSHIFYLFVPKQFRPSKTKKYQNINKKTNLNNYFCLKTICCTVLLQTIHTIGNIQTTDKQKKCTK